MARSTIAQRSFVLFALVFAFGGCGPDFKDHGVRRPDGGGGTGTPPPTFADGGAPRPGTDGGGPVRPPPISGDRYHPDDYAQVSVHGPESNMQVEDCRTCHGGDLTGGTFDGAPVPGCDDCHAVTAPGWRTDCTFCHGGEETMTGAPPRGIAGPGPVPFSAHTAHVSATRHPAYSCAQCHVLPTDVLSPGHAFDDTPGVVEVDMGGGLSPAGTWDGMETCQNLYCHGNGRGTAAASVSDPTPDCGTCHEGPSGSGSGGRLSGKHRRHRGLGCESCHGAVAGAGGTIVNAARHVDGRVDVDMAGTGVSVSSGRCTGFCHGRGHFYSGW